MKTKFNYLLVALLATTLCIGNTFGQSFTRNAAKATRFDYGDKLANHADDGTLATSRVSARALNAFSKSFPDATGAKWIRVGKMYGVDFIKVEKQNKVLYDVKGNLMYSLSYEAETD